MATRTQNGEDEVRTPDGDGNAKRRRRTEPVAKPQERAKKSHPLEALENSIRPRRVRARRTAPADEKSQTANSQNIAAANAAPGTSSSDPWTVPVSIRDRFSQEGHRFYFPDGARAFQDHGRRLSTPSENVELIRSLVEIAKARGWDTVVVSGTERFRQEAWRQARLEGLSVRGYRPTDPERAALAQASTRRREALEEAQTRAATAPGQDASPDRQSRDRGPEDSPTIAGRLLDHGRETYRFDPHAEMSYFVRVATREGRRTVWGKDLERAMAEALSRPQVGDEIALRIAGRDKVTVKRRERDAEGAVINESHHDAHRNRWVIETKQFLDAREAAAAVVRNPQIRPQEGVRSHPQLAGTYINLHAAELASKALKDPEDQKRFVALVRNALAEGIERGDPLHPVRLKERVHTQDIDRADRTAELPVRS